MTTPAQNTVNSGTKSDESDKLETKFGTGKDFDALVSTLKMAIERGDIDKENVHRMAHGLGIKPETLASMVGAPSKENIEAKDQDESPEPEVAPPDVQKNFKDFRDETRAAANVTESVTRPKGGVSGAQASKFINDQIKQIRTNGRREGKSSQQISKEVADFRRLQQRKSGGSSNPVTIGQNAQKDKLAIESDPIVQRRIRQIRMQRKS